MKNVYKSRQLLPFSGRIHVKIRISDFNGHWSVQSGVSFQGNLSRTFKLGLSEAITNALYKHFYKYGRPILKSDNVSLSDFIKSYDLKDWYILYITEDGRYKFKTTSSKTRTSNVKGKRTYANKRYLEIKYKNKRYSKTKFTPTSKKKVDNIIQELV